MTLYALIIAGGQGERLRPLTNDRPKPMVAVAGKPLLAHQFDWLRQGGVADVVILCHYMAHVIQERFGEGAGTGLRLSYSIEETPLGRGGALRRGYEAFVPPGEETVIALNGDIITGQPLEQLLQYHKRKRAAATVMLAPLRSPYGIARVDRTGRITSFIEKPVLPHWINAGVYVLSREFFRRLPAKGDHEDTTFPELAAEGKLFGYKSRAYWRAVDSVKDLNEAERELGGGAQAAAALSARTGRKGGSGALTGI